jgi:type IV pilus assembly protein PilF
MERGQHEVALEKLKRAVAYDKTYAPAHSMLAILYETIGEPEQAAGEYRQAVKYDPQGGEVNNNYGAFLCGSGEQLEAEPYFLVAVEDPFYPTPEIALSNAGSCALARGDLDKAESFLRQSLERDDKLGAALLPMAEVSYRKESFLQARAFLQRYEAVGPLTRESLALGYRTESRLGDQKAAERYRRELLERYPGSIKAGGRAGQEQQ